MGILPLALEDDIQLQIVGFVLALLMEKKIGAVLSLTLCL